MNAVDSPLALLARRLDRIAIGSGRLAAWLIVPMVLSLCYEVVSRYVFNAPTQWGRDWLTSTRFPTRI